jgi:hypothetical protein
MQLDSSTFPVVKIVFDAPSDTPPQDTFVAFEALLQREEPFVLLHEKAVDESTTSTPTKSANKRLSG